MTPRRIQLSRAKGWRMPANTVKVDRSTKWGNPFVVGASRAATPEWAVAAFKRAIADRSPLLCLEDVGELRGKNLACWCRPGAPCHADVLLEIANG